jgi:hypothetical protein
MTSEIELIQCIAERMRTGGTLARMGGVSLRVDTGARLPYERDVLEHRGKTPSRNEHDTELLLYDQLDEKWWTPRVVLECEQNDVTAHDAFKYSVRATTHKRAHPYLRYGILLAGRNVAPGRVGLFSHGNHFDFVACWEEKNASKAEWESFLAILTEETQVARKI